MREDGAGVRTNIPNMHHQHGSWIWEMRVNGYSSWHCYHIIICVIKNYKFDYSRNLLTFQGITKKMHIPVRDHENICALQKNVLAIEGPRVHNFFSSLSHWNKKIVTGTQGHTKSELRGVHDSVVTVYDFKSFPQATIISSDCSGLLNKLQHSQGNTRTT